jgi:hypothetical protein
MRVCTVLQMVEIGITQTEYEQASFLASCVIHAGAHSRNSLLPGAYRNGGNVRTDDAVNDMRRSVEEKY